MGYTIAVTGKGGVGKTTLAGLLIEYLIQKNRTPILAVDADANSNLNEVLGVEVRVTLGNLRENVINADLDENSPVPVGMTKQDYLDSSLPGAVTEEDDYDLLVMGRTQGKGCYCYVNGLLQAQLRRFANNYRCVVVDNEAGMEHISRGILPGVDMILIVSDASRRGIQAAARIKDLVAELGMRPSAVKLIVNRTPGGEIAASVMAEIEKNGFDFAGSVPADEIITKYDEDGSPTSRLPEESTARSTYYAILDKIL
ncbi:MAG: AAA family ATPase [Clostridiales Family XIII bacterium]|jgi:CO dehydrogenase maturation factor|nr:AAA family ATPase [Clostridiales Family XIII bacterium]